MARAEITLSVGVEDTVHGFDISTCGQRVYIFYRGQPLAVCEEYESMICLTPFLHLEISMFDSVEKAARSLVRRAAVGGAWEIEIIDEK